MCVCERERERRERGEREREGGREVKCNGEIRDT